MKKIGIMFGMENTFPPALVERINNMKVEGVTAEFVKLGGVKMAEPSGYRVIIDRISQDIPFLSAPTWKNAALSGPHTSSTIRSGGRPMTNSSTTLWHQSWVLQFRRR